MVIRSFAAFASNRKPRARSSALIFVCFSQLWHKHQPTDPQAVQLTLPFGQNRRAGAHMAWNYGAKLRIVGGHKPRDLSALGRVREKSQDCQIGLVDRAVEWEISDQRGMSVVEDGETIFECDEERRRGAAIRARRKRVVMGARTDFERNA